MDGAGDARESETLGLRNGTGGGVMAGDRSGEEGNDAEFSNRDGANDASTPASDLMDDPTTVPPTNITPPGTSDNPARDATTTTTDTTTTTTTASPSSKTTIPSLPTTASSSTLQPLDSTLSDSPSPATTATADVQPKPGNLIFRSVSNKNPFVCMIQGNVLISYLIYSSEVDLVWSK